MRDERERETTLSDEKQKSEGKKEGKKKRRDKK